MGNCCSRNEEEGNINTSSHEVCSYADNYHVLNENNNYRETQISQTDDEMVKTPSSNHLSPKNARAAPDIQINKNPDTIPEESQSNYQEDNPNQDESEENKEKKLLIDKFTTERLKLSEQRVGPFEINPELYQKYNIEQTESSENLIYKNFVKVKENALYEGYLNSDGKRENFGVLRKKDGIKYEGYWMDDKLNGLGRFIYKDGTVYEGHFVNGMLNGLGKESNEYYIYEGYFVEGKKHGKGKLERYNQEVYEGDFENDKKHGTGKLIFLKDLNEYEGEFCWNKLNGRGIYRWSNGDYYEGEFSNNNINGQGKYYWKNGDNYIGEYKNGLKNGKGKMIWSNGNVYEGLFKNNKPIDGNID